MRKLLNTLFVTSEDAYLALENENVIIYRDSEKAGQYPLHVLESILTFSYKGASPALMGACVLRGGVDRNRFACATGMKAVLGRKTDQRDAEWIADLLQHGLLKSSDIPNKAQRELRELVTYRRSRVGEKSRKLNRLHPGPGTGERGVQRGKTLSCGSQRVWKEDGLWIQVFSSR